MDTIVNTANRQDILTTLVRLDFAAETIPAGTYDIAVPDGAIVVGGALAVNTGDEVDGGVSIAVTGYIADTAAGTAGYTAAVPTGTQYAQKTQLPLVVTGTGTTGVANVMIQYVVAERSAFVQK